ncbi:MAG TPA: argininosuccinate lyase [Planctomycetota bacterium]|jgi:argininosuccinate lyase|nr:argininosuccinate lyase [Planctomycetota bacterium]OQC20372.1 MAG: Argininosuccinate lyase [Planctomycetes bacterium ADurb.Bin069]NMD36206.1 argininosuccinate lyase [Planctomycetota bacterium]HNR98643.1 argininosuccinate lyase [Planctomycetota bacterium]HNU25023.1 argininosuccinate lyase [Planctomycetota bacterium]
MSATPLWKGRLSGALDADFAAINASIDVDRRLWPQDVRTNRAYLKALMRAGLVTAAEGAAIERALDAVARDLAAGAVAFKGELEDIHMQIESELAARAGECAGKIHTGRSRNDQVATDLRLFAKEQAGRVIAELIALARALVARAAETRDVIMPAYTHLQRAQPVLLAHWFLAYAEMCLRDIARFAFARQQADALPLGLGACTGAPFAIDREFLARELGFARLCRNSLDGVSDRDFIVDYLAAAAGLFTHLSRLAEDLILWSSAEFAFVELAEPLSTGSSMMPQKRNPDSLELARGKAGRVFGNLMAMLTVLKGLPLAYNRDLQEDKAPLFDSTDAALGVLPVVRKVVATLAVRKERCAAALDGGWIEATAVADYLTRKGVPFRDAHKTVGAIVRDLAAAGRTFADLAPEEWRAYAPQLDAGVARAIAMEAIIAARDGIGGTAPSAVAREIERLGAELAALEAQEDK